MNCADNYRELLLYLEQAEGLPEGTLPETPTEGSDINETFENHHASTIKKQEKPLSNGLPKIEEENQINNSVAETDGKLYGDDANSDPEDIELNLQILIKLNDAIRSDLSELLANHNLSDFNEDDLTGYRFCRSSSSFGKYKDLSGYHQYDSGVSANDGFHLDDDEKSFIEIEEFSDLGSNSVETTTQTVSPSFSTTNLSWPNSPCSDTESSEGGDSWGAGCSKKGVWPIHGKSNSAPVLENASSSLQVSRQSRSQSDRHLAEIEAAEACKWLRATGFPQYAQMYEDMQFPIDLSQAALDHPRLENDVLHSLYRRIKILNGCAHLHQQHVTNTDESEAEEECALSQNWTYQSDKRRWSRTCALEPIPNLTEINKRFESSPDKDDVFEKSSNSPKERLRRSGSSKSRRRDGMFLSEREAADTVSVGSSVGSLKRLDLNHVSDSEVTPRHQRKVRTKSFDKTDTWAHPPTELDDVVWEKQAPTTSRQRNIRAQGIIQSGQDIPFHQVSATQFRILRKLALLKLTSYMEKYCPTHRTGWNWDIPKFIRKIKTPGYKGKKIFGVPLTIIQQRTGRVLPQNIEEALNWLQINASDHVGIFRKPGVKSRIQALRDIVETNICVDYSEQQSYDVADMVKQYFRDLPESLLTNKLSETFISIFQYVPVDLRREPVLCVLILMPNEHLEALQALLHFLVAIAKNSDVNQMNESNLAMCFSPSLFHYAQAAKQNVGTSHVKELADNKAAHDCLLYLLGNANDLFKISQDFIHQSGTVSMADNKAILLQDLGSAMGGWRKYLSDSQAFLLKEVKERSRGWINIASHFEGVQIASKIVADGIHLKLYKVTAEIEAPPNEVLHRLLRDRHVWDPELRSSKTIKHLDSMSEVFQFVRGTATFRPAEEYCVVRTWATDLTKSKDTCTLVETSVEHPDALPMPHSSRGLVLASRYLIEPCGSGKSKVHHFSRIDTMGRSPKWYKKHFGHMQAFFLSNIKNSFPGLQNSVGPETKV